MIPRIRIARREPACPIARGSGVSLLNGEVSMRGGGAATPEPPKKERQMKKGMQTTGVGAVCCAAVIIGFSISVAAGPPAKSVSVNSIVLDYAADIAPSLNVQSDGQGTYVPASSLVSQIQAIGDWELDARNPKNATRKIYVDFSQPIAGSAPGGGNPTSPPSGTYTFRAIAKCTLYGNSLFGFTVGATKTCPLHVGVDYGGSAWAFVMDPYTAANGPFPETNYATVTCIYPASGTSACSQWKFTPSGTYIAADGSMKYRNVAKLLENPTSNNPIDHGDFYVSFEILIAK
jgi:hypothetical protein